MGTRRRGARNSHFAYRKVAYTGIFNTQPVHGCREVSTRQVMVEKRPRIKADDSALNAVEGVGQIYGLSRKRALGAAIEFARDNREDFEGFLEEQGNSRSEKSEDDDT